MVENIHIAAGPLPEESGDPVKDLRELRRYLERLLGALERNFDQIHMRLEGEKNG